MSEQLAVMEIMALSPFNPIEMAQDLDRVTLGEAMDPGAQLVRDTFNNFKDNAREIALGTGLATVAGLGILAAGSIRPESAKATGPITQNVIGTPTTTDVTFGMKINGKSISANAFSSSEADAKAKVTVLGNIRVKGTPAKLIKKAEAEKKCRTIDGKKTELYTEGFNVAGGRVYGRDTRISRFCMINGKLVRIKCHNAAFIKKTPKPPVEGRIEWVNDMSKAKVTVDVRADSRAQAECKLNGTSATAFGEGHAIASASVRLKSLVKGKDIDVSGLKLEIANSANVEASAKASAKATANCSATEVVVVPPVVVVVPPKDGTVGPGTITPGPVGGPGAGGTPGNTQEGVVCRDPADNLNGDKNPKTEGALMYGTKVDQFGYCEGVAGPLV